ncbi:MAG: transporter [Thermosynechococcus sp.]|uniref:bile acid:sodium symporter family protein n=1 Tax=Thermosynechococcus sp. TaxID=2814275 RepID=UPI0022068225|nr:bile acid:sodium symporter family protein [Thermosynechococcus sp.]BCX12679.1 MAG: transporter [Thermosynechococcus sp.]
MSRLEWLTNLFPLWVMLTAIVALVYPPLFLWVNSDLIVWILMIVMLGMGITLSWQEFQAVGLMPRTVALGFVGQYVIMPTAGWLVAQLYQLPTPFAVGLILVACCPGGTASNVVTFIARAHVALSVVMTLCSTLAAIILTPLLTKLLAGQYVEVNALQLFWGTVQVVLLPILVGLALNTKAPTLVKKMLPISPLISVLGICVICGGVFAASAKAILSHGLQLLAAIVSLHSLGFLGGYYLARAVGYSERTCRTIAIEVGMQNSGLGVALARQAFANPLTAVPCAISGVVHSLIGSLLAGFWRWQQGAAAVPKI